MDMMTKNERLKRSILDNLNNEVFKKSFDDLFSLLAYEIARFAAKNKLFKKKKVSNYFWNQYCINNHDIVFSNSNYEFVLSWYLDNLDQTNDTLNKILIEDHPDKFIKSIRANRSFLNEEFFNKLQHYDWSSKYSIHILAWKELLEKHKDKQNAIDESWELIQDLDSFKILGGIIYWVDINFFKDYSDLNHQNLREVYNYALSYFFSKKTTINSIKEDQFDKLFLKNTQSSDCKNIEAFLDRILNWIEFENTILTSYCFDDNFQPKLVNGLLAFEFISEEEFSKWKTDEERYLINNKRYLNDALHYYKEEESKGELSIPEGKTEVDKNINCYCFIKNVQSILYLNDLHVKKLKYKGHSVHISKLVACLLSYSGNRQNRYVERMKKYMKRYSWLESYGKTLLLANKEGVTNAPMPYLYQTSEELFQIYRDAIDELEDNELSDLIDHFSYLLKPGAKFNPFDIKYNVLETPFLKIDKYIFTSTSLFSSNEWFYSVGQRALSIYANKHHRTIQNETSSEMERSLEEEFERHNWNVKVITQDETNDIEGDIDLFVDDGITQLLIQLKRTKLKLNLSSEYKDRLETDLKASGQLNNAVKFLQSNTMRNLEVFEKHDKWIVTTSFEGVLTKVDSCVKVNYFDLIWALRYKKFDSLDSLRNYIENDKPFVEYKEYLN